MTSPADISFTVSQPPQPPAQAAARVARLCRLIEAADEGPTLAELAAAVGLSPSHTQRMFTQVLGLSPRAYAAACRERRVRALLTSEATVTEAIYAAGYGSSGRFYERSTQLLGMTPSVYRAKGPDTDIRFAVGLIERPRMDVRLPLDVRGTAFQQRVWAALTKIPAGETRTYTQLAVELGAPRSARAVARACATNPVAVAIPCHRVVRADSNLAGYRWGIERKRELLLREAAH